MLDRLADDVDNGRSRSDHTRRDSHDRRVTEPSEGPGAHPVRRHEGGADPSISMLRTHNGDVGIGTDFDRYLAEIERGIGMKIPKATQRRKSPLLFSPTRHSKISRIKRPTAMQPGDGTGGFDGP